MGNQSARRLSRLRHHEYTSATASSPSFGPSSFWADAQSRLRTRRRHTRRWRRWATECAAIHPLRLNHAIGRTLDLRRRHDFDSHRSNPHSFVAFSGLGGAFRGFLHGGLSNTCPQAVGELGAVVVHGQVSDNPRPKRPYDVLESGRLGLRPVRLIDGSQPLHRTFKQASLAILLLCFAGRARRAYLASKVDARSWPQLRHKTSKA